MKRYVLLFSLVVLGCSDSQPKPTGCPGACVAEIAVGNWFACAQTSDAHLYCWGRNAENELGYATTALCPLTDSQGNVTQVACQNYPLQLPATPGAHVVAGAMDACIIAADGGLQCWGDNASSQLGDGTTIARLAPVTVPGVTGVTRVAVGNAHMCALTGAGVMCWGDNTAMQSGQATPQTLTSPTLVAALPGVTDLVAGNTHTCALTTAGEVWCWGDNTLGELGRGSASATPSATPQPVVTDASGTHLGHVTAIASAYLHTCAVRDDGAVVCWGLDAYGQLGTQAAPDATCGKNPCRAVALPVQTTIPSDAGAPAPDAAPPPPQTGPAFTSPARGVATGWSHSCAWLADGTARCWGYDGSGELGIGPGGPSRDPQAVLAFPGASGDNLLSGITSLRAAGAMTCALSSAGPLRCWGWNGVGQLGNGTLDTPLGPTPVAW